VILYALVIVIVADKERDRDLVERHVGDSAVAANTTEVQSILNYGSAKRAWGRTRRG
jgi:hypothetical protein